MMSEFYQIIKGTRNKMSQFYHSFLTVFFLEVGPITIERGTKNGANCCTPCFIPRSTRLLSDGQRRRKMEQQREKTGKSSPVMKEQAGTNSGEM